jgi:hypothetical protein
VNAPEIVLDDLGIFHLFEVPLPALYQRKPCKCGIIHKWEEPSTFELCYIELIKDGDAMGYPRKKVKRCMTCKEVLLLELTEMENEKSF